MPRPLDDLGPQFDRRWKQTPREQRRELISELRDLYLMLEEKDHALLSRLRGRAGETAGQTDVPLLVAERRPALQQGTLFSEVGETPAPEASALAPIKANPFLPRSVLDRLQESRSRASAGLRDLVASTASEIARQPLALDVAARTLSANMPPPSHEQSDLERELRLKLGLVVENLIEAQMEALRNELRVRLRLEMDRLIAEHVRK